MAKTPAKNAKMSKTKPAPKGTAVPKAGAKAPKKRMGKGARALVLLFGLGILTVLIGFIFQKLSESLTNSKTIPVMVDMEMGQGGDGPGHFREPAAVAVDHAGNFYVSDFSGHVIQKFDQNGSPLATIGKEGKDEGEFEQPSGIYVDAQDNLWVCDTFNHRVEEFDSDGQFVKAFTHEFFGPRSIMGTAMGRLYVSDTGNHRVKVFDMDGNFIKEFGSFGTGDGKFQEPVGITSDDKNNIYVADTDNNRIQKFDAEGKFLGAFKISVWKGKNDEKPYLAFSNGILWAAATSRGAVLALDPNGKLLAICIRKDVKEGFVGASGVAVSGDRVLVVERDKHQIARFAIPAIAGK